MGEAENGFIDEWLRSLDHSAETFNWPENYKRFIIEEYLGPKVKKYLRQFPEAELLTYLDVKNVLMERYGSQKTAEIARNNFPQMRQDKGEASEDFLDRLAREYRRGWAHERSQTVRDQMVLDVFMLGLSDENLATSLQMEYSKPSYVGHPPSVNELRAYVRRLESSRSLRTMKGGDATQSRAPSYTMRNSYSKENYPSRGQGPPDHAARSQQQNLQGYINPPTVQQWNRQGAGNVVDRDLAYAQNLCYKCGSSAHMTRECDAWIHAWGQSSASARRKQWHRRGHHSRHGAVADSVRERTEAVSVPSSHSETESYAKCAASGQSRLHACSPGAGLCATRHFRRVGEPADQRNRWVPGPGKVFEPQKTPGAEVMMIDAVTGNFRPEPEEGVISFYRENY